MKNALVAVPKGKGQCPPTTRQSGNYCIDPMAYFKAHWVGIERREAG
jgi:hypothetical protein